jgi:NifB/MoaA-like Fe-S oxidoreductase
VVCPGVNDGDVLDDTLCGILDEYPTLDALAVVPLGVSRWNREPEMRPHTTAEAERVLDVVGAWQATYLRLLGRRLVHAADEYYLLAGRPFPPADDYEGFAMHEDGIGMARTFERELLGLEAAPVGVASGFFAWVDGAPAAGYRAPRTGSVDPTRPTARCDAGAGAGAVATIALRPSLRAPVAVLTGTLGAPVAVLTGTLGAPVLRPLLAAIGRDDVRVVPVANEFFGGNVGVTGLLTGADLARVLAEQPEGHRYLLPDVCLSEGRFLDGTTPADLPRAVEVIATDGVALREALR